MDPSTDPFRLTRFVVAQAPVYRGVVEELRAGRKRGHWMWFVFPQLRGLGSSPTALQYGITCLAEARAYLAHELLGPRLHECARLVGQARGRSAAQIFGSPDDLKLRSSMTLFAVASNDHQDFATVLDTFYRGERDPLTLARLKD